MASKDDGCDEGAACRLYVRLVNGGANEMVWAGLPVNLDLAFSQNQRDKVVAQYQMLSRGTRRALRYEAPVCSCEDAGPGCKLRLRGTV